jgi:kynureninase
MDDLLGWRTEFPILDQSVYLISNSLGAMPFRVYESVRAYADTWATRGVRAWGDSWWEMPVAMGDLLAPILGSGPAEVSFHQNVTLAEGVVLSCFDFTGPKRKIVYTSMEFPSVMYLYQAARERGAEVVCVPSRDGIRVELEDVLGAIDSSTLLVPISHVLFKSAFIMDVAAIVQRAHEVGALVVLDVYQSAGTIPIDVRRLDVDFAIGGCLKWLCGGPGAAFLWVRPELRSSLQPRLTGWMAHEHSFAFEPELSLRQDAFRFLNGTPPIPCLYTARPGLEILGSVGIEAVRRKSTRQTRMLIDLARAEGFSVRSPEKDAERGGTVTVDLPYGYEISRELIRREFLVDFRAGAGIRVSPHFYTADSELEAVIGEIRDIVHNKAYEKHRVTRTYVT